MKKFVAFVTILLGFTTELSAAMLPPSTPRTSRTDYKWQPIAPLCTAERNNDITPVRLRTVTHWIHNHVANPRSEKENPSMLHVVWSESRQVQRVGYIDDVADAAANDPRRRAGSSSGGSSSSLLMLPSRVLLQASFHRIVLTTFFSNFSGFRETLPDSQPITQHIDASSFGCAYIEHVKLLASLDVAVNCLRSSYITLISFEDQSSSSANHRGNPYDTQATYSIDIVAALRKEEAARRVLQHASRAQSDEDSSGGILSSLFGTMGAAHRKPRKMWHYSVVGIGAKCVPADNQYSCFHLVLRGRNSATATVLIHYEQTALSESSTRPQGQDPFSGETDDPIHTTVLRAPLIVNEGQPSAGEAAFGHPDLAYHAQQVYLDDCGGSEEDCTDTVVLDMATYDQLFCAVLHQDGRGTLVVGLLHPRLEHTLETLRSGGVIDTDSTRDNVMYRNVAHSYESCDVIAEYSREVLRMRRGGQRWPADPHQRMVHYTKRASVFVRGEQDDVAMQLWMGHGLVLRPAHSSTRPVWDWSGEVVLVLGSYGRVPAARSHGTSFVVQDATELFVDPLGGASLVTLVGAMGRELSHGAGCSMLTRADSKANGVGRPCLATRVMTVDLPVDSVTVATLPHRLLRIVQTLIDNELNRGASQQLQPVDEAGVSAPTGQFTPTPRWLRTISLPIIHFKSSTSLNLGAAALNDDNDPPGMNIVDDCSVGSDECLSRLVQDVPIPRLDDNDALVAMQCTQPVRRVSVAGKTLPASLAKLPKEDVNQLRHAESVGFWTSFNLLYAVPGVVCLLGFLLVSLFAVVSEGMYLKPQTMSPFPLLPRKLQHESPVAFHDCL